MTSCAPKQIQELNELESIQEILNKAAKIFGNAIMINDTSYNLLCYSEGIETDDHIWNELIRLGGFSHETVNFFNTERFIYDFANSATVTLMHSDKLKYDRLNCKLFDADGVQLANVLVLGCFCPITKQHYGMLESLGEILSDRLQKSPLYAKIDRVYQETVFNKLLDGQTPASKDDRETLTSLFDRLDKNIYVAMIDTAGYDKTFTHLAYFRDVFRKISDKFFFFVHKENVAAFFCTDNDQLKITRELGKLDEFFRKNQIFAGISAQFHNLFDAHEYAKQAYVALNYGQNSGRNSQIFFFDDFRLEYFLPKTLQNYKEIYNPLALRVLDADRANGTDYAEILYAFMLYGRNKTLMANKLAITEEQTEKKIQQVVNLFDIDINNGDAMMNIFITLKLVKTASC